MVISTRFRRSCSRASRFAAVVLALAGYLVAATGVPLPVVSGVAIQAKDRSEPFPCMDRPCGCHSAMQCWTSCCCTTPAERLAWARERGIKPPIELASGESAPVAAVRPVRSCCAAGHRNAVKASCCASPSEAAGHCHAANPPAENRAKQSTSPAAKEPAQRGLDFVVISAWRHCNGLAPLWSFLAAALSPPAPAVYEFDWQPAGWLSLRCESAESLALSPAIPPPRV